MRYVPFISAITIGAVSIVLGIPLFLKRIAPNGMYGYRTIKTLGDPAIWYQANRYCGRAMIYAGVITLAGALVLMAFSRFSSLSPKHMTIAAITLEIGPLCIALLFSYIYVSKL